ncbi:unnamed protein product, partial [Ectocarpus sp. 12 AP-2014]
ASLSRSRHRFSKSPSSQFPPRHALLPPSASPEVLAVSSVGPDGILGAAGYRRERSGSHIARGIITTAAAAAVEPGVPGDAAVAVIMIVVVVIAAAAMRWGCLPSGAGRAPSPTVVVLLRLPLAPARP